MQALIQQVSVLLDLAHRGPSGVHGGPDALRRYYDRLDEEVAEYLDALALALEHAPGARIDALMEAGDVAYYTVKVTYNLGRIDLMAERVRDAVLELPGIRAMTRIIAPDDEHVRMVLAVAIAKYTTRFVTNGHRKDPAAERAAVAAVLKSWYN